METEVNFWWYYIVLPVKVELALTAIAYSMILRSDFGDCIIELSAMPLVLSVPFVSWILNVVLSTNCSKKYIYMQGYRKIAIKIIVENRVHGENYATPITVLLFLIKFLF